MMGEMIKSWKGYPSCAFSLGEQVLLRHSPDGTMFVMIREPGIVRVLLSMHAERRGLGTAFIPMRLSFI